RATSNNAALSAWCDCDKHGEGRGCNRTDRYCVRHAVPETVAGARHRVVAVVLKAHEASGGVSHARGDVRRRCRWTRLALWGPALSMTRCTAREADVTSTGRGTCVTAGGTGALRRA